MIQFLLRILLAIITFGILIRLMRAVARIASRDPDARLDPGHDGSSARGRHRSGHRAPKPIVDRASAIDVPFTEDPTEP